MTQIRRNLTLRFTSVDNEVIHFAELVFEHELLKSIPCINTFDDLKHGDGLAAYVRAYLAFLLEMKLRKFSTAEKIIQTYISKQRFVSHLDKLGDESRSVTTMLGTFNDTTPASFASPRVVAYKKRVAKLATELLLPDDITVLLDESEVGEEEAYHRIIEALVGNEYEATKAVSKPTKAPKAALRFNDRWIGKYRLFLEPEKDQVGFSAAEITELKLVDGDVVGRMSLRFYSDQREEVIALQSTSLQIFDNHLMAGYTEGNPNARRLGSGIVTLDDGGDVISGLYVSLDPVLKRKFHAVIEYKRVGTNAELPMDKNGETAAKLPIGRDNELEEVRIKDGEEVYHWLFDNER